MSKESPTPPNGTHTAKEVRALLKAEVKYEGSQRALAKLIGVSSSFLNDILLGKREPSGKPVTFLGLKRVVLYQVKATAKQGEHEF